MKQKKKWVVLALTVLLLGAGGLFLYRSGFFAACTSIPALRAYIDRSAPYSHLTFFVVQLLSVVLAPIPSNLTAAAGGLLFGTWPAFFLTYGAVMAGSLLVFWLARTLGRDFVDRVVSRKLAEKYQKVIREKTTVFLALAFLLPYFPDDMLCILAGLTPITFGRFALLALFTRPWGLLFASALGGASLSIPLWAMVLIGLAGVMIFVLGMLYGDRLERAVLKRLGKE